MKLHLWIAGLFLVFSPGLALAQDENLIVNGNFAAVPPTSTPGTEDHAAAYKVPVPVGSSLLPGWGVSRGKIYVGIWKDQWRCVQLDNASGISQTVATVPKAKYKLRFSMKYDGEGPAVQHAIARCGDHSQEFDARSKSYSDLEFTADSSTTRVEIYGTNKGLGPLVYEISLREVNPKKSAAQAVVRGSYHNLDLLLKDANPSSDLLTDDFKYTDKAGASQDKVAWLAYYRGLAEKNPLISSVVAHSQPDADGNLIVYVKRRVSYDGGGTHRTVVEVLVKEIWVPVGDTWKLQSSKEE